MAKALWCQEHHAHVCVDCGKELSNSRAKRCPECAAQRERELDRARCARRRAARAEEKKKAAKKETRKPVKKTVNINTDRGHDMDKKTFRELKTSKLRADNARAEDAMRKAAVEKRRAEAAEKRRIEESVVMLKAIHARYHQRKKSLRNDSYRAV